VKETDRKYQRNILLPVAILLLIGFIVILLDRRQIMAVLRQAEWYYLPGALFFTALSYLFICSSYVILARRMGIRMPRLVLGETFFVTTVMNHVIGSGGIAGFSVRALIMKQYGVPVNDSLSSSFIHWYLASLDMLIMLPVGAAYLFSKVPLPRGIAIILITFTLLWSLVALLLTLIVFSDRLRSRAAGMAAAVVRKIAHREVSLRLQRFNRRMTEGTRVLRRYPLAAGLVIVLIFADWWCSVFALNLCLDAFGPPLTIGATIAIFVIGIVAGLAATIPGGIGVQEGAMAGLGVMLGATFEQAILAAILLRILYYFLPYLVSPLFYLRLLRPPDPETAG
jgi:uncharacterized protein (TIRG00374 family)